MEVFWPEKLMCCRVLIAEDSPDDLFFLLRAIKNSQKLKVVHTVSHGMEVIRYLTGQGAYADRHRFPIPHLLITDLKMPGFDGLELLQWLESHGPFPHLIVIMLTGSSIESDIKTARKLGVDAFFTKPIHEEQLQGIIRTIERLVEESPKAAFLKSPFTSRL
jgi:CheY-like chemotaxis protein